MHRLFVAAAVASMAIVTVPAVVAQTRSNAPASSALAKSAKLRNPAALKEKAPETYKVKFDTTKGIVVIEVHREWAPLGADRFYNLVKNGFFDGVRFFRVIPDFMAQFGINGDPAVDAAWDRVDLKDDPGGKKSNTRGYITYGTTGQPNSRGTQVFINYKDNSFLDRQGFVPFGLVVTGMEVVDKFNTEYGTRPQDAQQTIKTQGNKFLIANFPKLDYIKKGTIEP